MATRRIRSKASIWHTHASSSPASPSDGSITYAHVGESSAEPYRRIAGPALAADLADLEPVVQLVASLVKLPISFEEAASLQPWDFFRCVG